MIGVDEKWIADAVASERETIQDVPENEKVGEDQLLHVMFAFISKQVSMSLSVHNCLSFFGQVIALALPCGHCFAWTDFHAFDRIANEQI